MCVCVCVCMCVCVCEDEIEQIVPRCTFVRDGLSEGMGGVTSIKQHMLGHSSSRESLTTS